MNMALCSSTSLELKNPFIEGTRGKIATSKSFLRVGYVAKNEKSCCCNGRKVAVSSHSMPGHLEESFMGKKRMEKPSRKMDFVRTLLIDNYDSYTFNIYQELSVVNGGMYCDIYVKRGRLFFEIISFGFVVSISVPPVVIRNDEWTWEDVCHYLYEKRAFDNIVISPGPGSPTCATDIGKIEDGVSVIFMVVDCISSNIPTSRSRSQDVGPTYLCVEVYPVSFVSMQLNS